LDKRMLGQAEMIELRTGNADMTSCCDLLRECAQQILGPLVLPGCHLT